MDRPSNASTANSPALANRGILATIVLVAALTHLPFQNLAEFRGDESRVAGIAVAFLEGRMLPLIGIPSSVGVNNPPAFVYLMALPLAISRDPAFASGFIGLLAVGTVLLCYRFCDEHFDRRTAQVAAVLFAVAPTAVIFSRKIQAQDVVPFLVLLWLGSLFQLARGRPAYHLVGVALWLSILIQLHFAAVTLIPLTAIALAYIWLRPPTMESQTEGQPRGAASTGLISHHSSLATRRSSLVRWAGGAVGLTVLLWIPYLIFQVTHEFADLRAVKNVLSLPAQTDPSDFSYLWTMVSTNAYDGWTGVGESAYRAQTISFDGLYRLELILFAASVLAIVGRLIVSRLRSPGDWRYVFLLLWLVIPPLAFVRHSSPIYPHYFLIVFPAQFIAMGLLFSSVERWVSRRWPALRLPALAAGGIVVGALVLSQVYGLLTVMDFIAREPTDGGHGVPLLQHQLAIDRAVALSDGSTKPVYLAASGSDDPNAFAYLAHDRLTLKIFDDSDTFVAPLDDGKPTLYLTANPKEPAAQLIQQRFADRLVDTIPFPGSTGGFSLYRLDPNLGDQFLPGTTLRPLPATLPNGIRLLGYELPSSVRAGQSIQLGLYWQVTSLPAGGEDYAFFTHLVDESGHVWGQLDALGYPPYFWQVGDLVVSWFNLTVDPKATAGAASIETGMYRRSDIGRLPIHLDAGPTADHVLLGPIKLVAATTTPPPSPGHPQVAHFGSAIDLVGYDISNPVTAGSNLHVTLTWLARQTPAADYTTFVHLLDSTGKIAAQSDGRPGLYPTSLWTTGDITSDPRVLQLPPTLPSGSYTVEIGLYRQDTQARLTVDGTDHVDLGTAVLVGGS